MSELKTLIERVTPGDVFFCGDELMASNADGMSSTHLAVLKESSPALKELICHLVNKASKRDALVEVVRAVISADCVMMPGAKMLLLMNVLADYQNEPLCQDN